MSSRHKVLEYSKPGIQGNTIIGVKVIGCESVNGYKYPQEVLRKAKALYESVGVFALHPTGREDKAGVRKLNAHFGNLVNVRERGQADSVGLFADLQMRPSHPASQYVLENPDASVGLSHNAVCDFDDEETTVTEIIAVNSVDLVSKPATTRNLFEGETMPDETTPAPAPDAADGGDATTDGSFEDKMLGFMAKILAYVEPKDAALVKDAEAAGAVQESVQRPPRFKALESAADSGRPKRVPHEDLLAGLHQN